MTNFCFNEINSKQIRIREMEFITYGSAKNSKMKFLYQINSVIKYLKNGYGPNISLL